MHSVNNDTIDELLDPCIYGTCIRRILHCIHAMRLLFPFIAIYITKTDLHAAYQPLHVVANHAIRAITILKGLAFIILCLPFGTAAGPALYSQVSESIFDLTNDLLEDKT